MKIFLDLDSYKRGLINVLFFHAKPLSSQRKIAKG
jgi:hypothetical protein